MASKRVAQRLLKAPHGPPGKKRVFLWVGKTPAPGFPVSLLLIRMEARRKKEGGVKSRSNLLHLINFPFPPNTGGKKPHLLVADYQLVC